MSFETITPVPRDRDHEHAEQIQARCPNSCLAPRPEPTTVLALRVAWAADRWVIPTMTFGSYLRRIVLSRLLRTFDRAWAE